MHEPVPEHSPPLDSHDGWNSGLQGDERGIHGELRVLAKECAPAGGERIDLGQAVRVWKQRVRYDSLRNSEVGSAEASGLLNLLSQGSAQERLQPRFRTIHDPHVELEAHLVDPLCATLEQDLGSSIWFERHLHDRTKDNRCASVPLLWGALAADQVGFAL